MKSRTWMWMSVVSLFTALATIAQAEIVYTPVNVNLPTNGYYAIDLNHDGVTDFTFQISRTGTQCGLMFPEHTILKVQPNSAGGIVGAGWASALQSGVLIDFRQSFYRGTSLMYDYQQPSHCIPAHRYGYWFSIQHGYLGLEFQINGQTHYGWAELSTNGYSDVNTLYGFAYETIAFKAIKTGQTMDSPDAPGMGSPASPAGMAAEENSSPDNKHRHHQYRLIDLGTFGGPQGYLSCCEPVSIVLDNRGTVAGAADTSTSDPNYPNASLWLPSDPFIMHAFQWRNGVLTDLGALPGVNSSFGNWISANGLVAGLSENGVIDPLLGIPEAHAVLWKNGRMIDLGTLEGGYESYATGVNSNGQVTGSAVNTIPDPFSPFGLQNRGFLWQDGRMHDLGTLGGPDTAPGPINERGQIAGFSLTSFIPNPTTGIPTVDPFLWKDGHMLDLGTLGGTIGNANALNGQGQVAGQSNLAGDLTFHPFLWSRGVLTDLGTFGGSTGVANWLNDDGAVVGKADLPGSQTHDGFLWKRGALTDLGTVDGDPCSNALAINSSGQIVGGSGDCSSFSHAFIWENGGPMVDLNTLIPPGSAITLTEATLVNDLGEIAAQGTLSDGDTHAILLIPCDEKHPGQCDDYSMIEVATPQSGLPKAEFPVTMKRGSEAPVSPVERFRNMMRQRNHLPGQPSAQRD